MPTILMAWIGHADRKAPENATIAGREDNVGPIGQALAERRFDHAVLLHNEAPQKLAPYLDWLRAKTGTPITTEHHPLQPTDLGPIYRAARAAVANARQTFGAEADLVYHFSPGTGHMSAVWLLLHASTAPAAEFIDSSIQQGVRTLEWPFDISAEFRPSSDGDFRRMLEGLPANEAAFDNIIGDSPALTKTKIQARKIAVAPAQMAILIEGETGTGKELFARAIHQASDRQQEPFVALNCGAFSEALMESQLFGHKRGAFTGATTTRGGLLDQAHTGTVFLDEIGEMPLSLQVKLLRVIQERKFRPVGDTREIELTARIIAATNRSLAAEAAQGTFRTDLYYRLRVLPLRLPSLQEREGDVGRLVDHFAKTLNEMSPFDVKPRHLTAGARQRLIRGPWPGNVRDLEMTMSRIWCLCHSQVIQDEDIDEWMDRPLRPASDILNQPLGHGLNLKEGIIPEVARHYIERALAETGGNKSAAAKLLGFDNPTIFTSWTKKHCPSS